MVCFSFINFCGLFLFLKKFFSTLWSWIHSSTLCMHISMFNPLEIVLYAHYQFPLFFPQMDNQYSSFTYWMTHFSPLLCSAFSHKSHVWVSGFSVLYWQSTCTLMPTYAPMSVRPPMPNCEPMSHTILITTNVWYCLHTTFFFRSGMVILSYILNNSLSRPHR